MPREVFGLEAAGESGSWGHAQAFLSVGASADASLRRGLSLTADVGAQLGASAEARKILLGSVTGGAQAALALGVEARFPLDLFGHFGLVVSAQASARASAWVRAEAGLSMEELAQLVAAKLDGQIAKLAMAVLGELDIRAGFVARASFAAEVQARLMLAGSLVSTPLGPPGFTIVANAGAALGGGAGYGFVAGFGISNVDRLLGRVAAVVGDAVDEQIRLIADNDSTAKALQPLVRVLVQAALSAAMSSGKALIVPPGAARAAAVRELGRQLATAVASGVVNELIAVAFNFSAAKLNAALSGASLDADKVARLRAALNKLASWTSAWPTFTAANAWAVPAVMILDALSDILDVLRDSGFDVPEALDALTLGSTAVFLAGRAQGAPVPWPPDNVRALIVTELGLEEDAAVDVAEAVAFIARGLEGLVSASVPPGILAVMAQVPLDARLTALRVAFELSADVPDSLVDVLATALAPIITASLVPSLEKARDSADPAAAAFLNEVALPLVRVLPLILPNIADVRTLDGEAAIVMRERISLSLLAVFSKVLLTTGEVLVDRAMRDGAAAARQIATQVEQLQRDDVFHRILFVASSLLFRVTPPDEKLIADVLRLSADISEHWNEHVRTEQFQLLQAVLKAAIEATDPQLANALNDPQKPVGAAELEALATRTATGNAQIIGVVADKLPGILLAWAERQANQFTSILAGGVEAAHEALMTAVHAAGDLLDWAAKLAADAAAAIAAIETEISQFANKLLQQLAQGHATLRERIWSDVVLPAINWNPVYNAAPAPVQEALRNGIRDIYVSLFNASASLFSAPLTVLRDAPTWTRQLITSQIQSSSVDTQRLVRDLRSKAMSLPGATVQLPLKFTVGALGINYELNLGTLSVGYGTVLGWLFDLVLGALGSGSNSILGRIGSHAQTAVEAIHQRSVALQQAATVSPYTAADAAGLTPDLPLTCSIVADGQSPGGAQLIVGVRGVNDSFFEQVANVPPRVQLSMDGRVVPLTLGSWAAAGPNERLLKLRLATSPEQAAPFVPTRAKRIALAMGDAKIAVRDDGALELRSKTAIDADLVGVDGTVPADHRMNRTDTRQPLALTATMMRAKAKLAASINNAKIVVDDEPATLARHAGLAVSARNRTVLANAVARQPLMTLEMKPAMELAPAAMSPGEVTWLSAGRSGENPTLLLLTEPGVHVVMLSVADGTGRKATSSFIATVPQGV